jgi:high-affinity Fe2+/Pb2+ permease
MDQNLVLIIISGLLILGLDHFNRWSYCQREIRSGKEHLRKLALWPLAMSSENKVKSNIR